MKVLIWNIQNFTLSRVFNPTGASQQEVSDNNDRAFANWTYIMRTVVDTGPDIVILIEPRCSQGPVGRLAGGDGVTGLLFLLTGIRLCTKNQWMLVPPLTINQVAWEAGEPVLTRSETVGVFWRDDNLQFTGPWIWPAAAQATGPPVPPGPTAANYPDNYNGKIVPTGTQVAPAYDWSDKDYGGKFEFPNQFDRRPLLTTFLERSGTKRKVNVMAFHPSPRRDILRPGFTKLSRLVEQYYKPGDNEVMLLAGDMNIDLKHLKPGDNDILNFFESDSWMTPPFLRVAPNPLAPTMLRRSATETGDPGALATPALYTKDSCIDYGWVCYGNGAAKPAGAPAARVVDRVAGAAAAPPFPQFTEELAVPLTKLLGIPDENADVRNAAFRFRWNFGHISPPAPGTSDHLPVLMVI